MNRKVVSKYITTVFVLALTSALIAPMSDAAQTYVPIFCGCINIGDDVNNIDKFTDQCEERTLFEGYPRFRVRPPEVGEIIPRLQSTSFAPCDMYIDGKASCVRNRYTDAGDPEIPTEAFMCIGSGL